MTFIQHKTQIMDFTYSTENYICIRQPINSSLQEFLRCFMKGIDKLDQIFPREYNSHFFITLGLSPCEMTFHQKPRKPESLQKMHSKTHKDTASHQKIQYFII